MTRKWNLCDINLKRFRQKGPVERIGAVHARRMSWAFHPRLAVRTRNTRALFPGSGFKPVPVSAISSPAHGSSRCLPDTGIAALYFIQPVRTAGNP